MIKQNNPLLYIRVDSELGLKFQFLASVKGFTWANGNKVYNPYFPAYALAFDFEDKVMYYYTLSEALEQLPGGRRTLREMKGILNKI